MAFEKIAQLLKDSMGLTAESVGASSIERAAKQRMRACKISNATRYYHTVSTSPSELKALTEAAIIPETWFFRDHQPFLALQMYVKTTWARKGLLKILSLPCSTGEEPYSIAMSLLQAGLQRQQFVIDAIDISTHNITQAKKAHYSNNSFRGQDLAFRAQYFSTQAGCFVLNDEVRASVRLHQGNLLDPIFRPFESSYHLVFCRNLLIYFDRPTQALAVKKFHKWLAEEGILFVGHAEMGAVDNQLFMPMDYSKAFAFSKRPAVTQTSTWAEPKKVSERRKKAFIQPLVERRTAASTAKPKPTQAMPEPAPEPTGIEALLSQAESLANTGQLSEAANLCASVIEQYNQDSRGYFLMGVIREAVGQKEAAFVQFKRVTYLDPNHHDALIHLVSLSQQKGDSRSASAYQQRADRVKARHVQTVGSDHA